MKHQRHKGGKAQDVWFDASTFAASIRAKRGQRSLREIASEIGAVSPSTLARLECSAIPGIETFLRLCDWLEQPTSAFIRLDTVVPGIHSPGDSIQMIEQELRADGVLSPQVVDAFITIIRAVRSSLPP